MIDISRGKLIDIWNNDEARTTEMFFDLPAEMAKEMAENAYKKAYEEALGNPEEYGDSVTPHFELQFSCPYGEVFESLGSVELGIGIVDDAGTEVLDIVSLVPGIDFSVDDAFEMWKGAIEKETENDMEL